ncbi:MAG: FAD-dependent oxidoreductase, partial [Actinomycetota bacterium]
MADKERPLLLAVSDNPEMLAVMRRELEARYTAHYEVVCESSAAEALSIARNAAESNRPLAVALAGVWMEEMPGVELLSEIAALHPPAKRALVAKVGDRDAWQAIQQPMITGAIDGYLQAPLVSPDERFHRLVTDLLDEWSRTEGEPWEMVRIVGEDPSPRSHRIRDLLERNGVPSGFYPASSPKGMELLDKAGAAPDRLPVVLFMDERVLIQPSDQEVADAITGGDTPDWTVFDVAILGGGPAGLAAGVHAASEGLSAFVLDREAMGGQAGTTSMVRNYLGFPRGISGQELAYRAALQMFTFGVAVQFLRDAVALR